MRTIEKHQVGKILSLIKKGIGVADWFVPTHLDIDSKPILEYRENRARNKYKMHKIGTYPLKECAQFVNKYFGIDKGGGSAWSHVQDTLSLLSTWRNSYSILWQCNVAISRRNMARIKSRARRPDLLHSLCIQSSSQMKKVFA